MNCNPLRDEEIIFGTTFNDGHFSSFFHRSPSARELQDCWEKEPSAFIHHNCPCGHESYAYADILQENPDEPGMVKRHETGFYCPACGRREAFGGSYFRSMLMHGTIRSVISKKDR